MSDASKISKPPGFDFPDDYSQCIAKIISNWASLEYNINICIWHLAGVYPAVGVCMTEQIFTLENRVKALLALLKLRRASKELLKRINKFAERAHKPKEIRNRVAHDTWHQGVDSKQISQLEIGAKGTLTYGFRDIMIEALRKDSETVRLASCEASELRNAIELALPTLPEIPLAELHPIVLHSGGSAQTRSTGRTFVLFPPKPSQE